MKRLGEAVLLLFVCLGSLIQVACEQDPARSVKIAQASTRAGAPAPAVADAALSDSRWRPERCPPPPEAAGGSSTLIGSGACAFQQQGAANCSTTDDDLLMEALRPMPGDALFMVYLSIENFGRPGKFENAQLVVGVQAPQGLYRWASDKVRITVAPDQNSVKITEAHLPPVPPLRQGEVGEVIVSGTFMCGPKTARGGARGR